VKPVPQSLFTLYLVGATLIQGVASEVAWDGGGDGTSWNDPLNWSTDAVPGPTDDVTIGLPGADSLTISVPGAQTVNRLENHAILAVQGGLLRQHAVLEVLSGAVNAGRIVLSSVAGYTARLAVSGGTLTNASGGVIEARDGETPNSFLDGSFLNHGTVIVQANAVLLCTGPSFLNDVEGLISGKGTLNALATTFTNAGTVRPGASPGFLTFIGEYIQTPTGRLDIELGGPIPGMDYDRLIVSGTANLEGELKLSLIAGYAPPIGSSFRILSAATRNGEFSTIQGPAFAFSVSYPSDGVDLTVVNTPAPPPIITSQPSNQTNKQGATASFTVSAESSAALTYQWRFNGADIVGATGQTLTIANIGPRDAGRYSVRVSNSSGYDDSDNAVLRVIPVSKPASPFDGNLIVNGNAEDGPGSGTGNVVPEIPGWFAEGNFTVVQYGAIGEFPSASIPTSPAPGANLFAGGPEAALSKATQWIDLSAFTTAIDAGGVTFDLHGYLGGWEGQDDHAGLRVTFRNTQGDPLSTATLGPVSAADRNGITSLLARSVTDRLPVGTRQIEVVLEMNGTDGSWNDGYADDLSLTLTLDKPPVDPVVLTQPRSQTVEAGRTVSFVVVARGTGTIHYQWYFEGNPIEGATAATLTLSRVRLNQAGNYHVVVNDAVGIAQSATAALTVIPDTATPVVAEFTPLGNIALGVTNVQFRFSETIRLESLTPEDVQVTTPSGLLDSSQIKIQQINDLLFRAIFPEQTAAGSYRVRIGPDVFDLAGNAMAGAYEGSFTIDRSGPVLANLRHGGTLLEGGAVVRNSGMISVDATDNSGVTRVEFYSDTQSIGTDSNPADGFSVLWDLDLTPDGGHTVETRAFDALGNAASLAVPVTVAMAPPPPPAIVSPADGSRTNGPLMVLRGTTARNTTVVFYRNGAEVGARVPVTVSGIFEAPVPLLEGTNQIQVSAINRGGEGAKSSPWQLIFDRSAPAAPVALQARPRDGGRVLLDWANPQPELVRGYLVYRARARFTEPAQAIRLTGEPMTELSFTDSPPGDGAYFYAVSTVNTAGTEGPLSALAEAVSDATPPVALQVGYFPEGRFDPATGVYGTGPIRVEVTMSEPLLAPPFFSLTPSNGIPILVELTPMNSGASNQYSGRCIVSSETPSGPALALLSARDRVGNRGSTIASGATVLELDTAGPQIVGLEVAPARVIRNDPAAPVTVVWTAHLDEAVRTGTTPEFRYSLSRSQPNETPVTAIEPGSDPLTWIVRVALPAAAGTEPEDLVLEFRAEDALQNVGTRILPEHRFQVYHGDLPQLVPPGNLLAQSMAGGAIRLTWLPVAEAVDYDVFRKKLEEANFTLLQRVGLTNQLTDLPAEDGGYHYVVAAVRRENGQESVGKWSSVAQAISDRVPPGPPRQLTLELASNGVFARWQPPQGVNETITYGLVRAATGPIGAVDGIAPFREKIPTTQVVDPSPTPAEAFYAVYAEDSVGNRSQPSNTEYLNAQLLPVQDLTVVQQDDSAPVLTWTQPSPSATGYDVYLGPDENSLKLNPSGPLTSRTFTDAGYSGDDRLYTIFTLDATGHRSLGRSIVLPAVQSELAPDALIRRGLMNRVNVEVRSLSAYPLENARVVLTLGTLSHVSESFRLEPGATDSVGVVVGGYADLPDGTAPIRITLENEPNEGETARLSQLTSIPIGDGQLVVGVLPRDFTRGGSGTVQFSLRNPGDVEMEVITSRAGGVSPDIRFNLRDAEGNLLSTAPFQAVLDPNLVSLSNDDTVLRLGPGVEALSPTFALEVPTNAPNRVFVQLEIDQVYYRSDQPERVVMQGLQTRAEVPVVDTTYTGLVTAVTPADSLGDQPVQISGVALLRTTGAPAPHVPLLVKIAKAGFERTDTVTTDAQGAFRTTFQPLPGESGGVYSVWAVHPDLRDRAVQQTFTIRRVLVSPAQFSVRAPFNFPQLLSLTATAEPGTTATNLRIVARPEDQPNGILPRDVTVDSGPVVAELGAGTTATLTPAITAGDNAAAHSQLILAVVSDDNPNPWQKLTADLEFSQAAPEIRWSPSTLWSGVAPGSNVLAQVLLENVGLVTAREVRVELKSPDGSPAPAWAQIVSPAALEQLPLGGRFEISLAFQPGTNVLEKEYEFQVLISATNHPTKEVPAFVAVSKGGRGDLLFKVVDMRTEKDVNGNWTGGLTSASIYLEKEPQFELEPRFETNRVTEADGEALFQDLPAGRYRYRITADSHNSLNGRVWVRPGATTTEQAALAYSLVTVEWEVVPITIEDRYEIVLQAVFETDVPAPVVVIEPAAVNLPQLFAGDVFYGEFSVQNHGLIRADDFVFQLPASDDTLEFELMGGLPDRLYAKQRLRVPYRITCKKSMPGPNAEPGSAVAPRSQGRPALTRAMGDGSPAIQALGQGQTSSKPSGSRVAPQGGSDSSGCYSYTAGAQCHYRYECDNGLAFTGGASAGWHYNYSRGCPGGGGGGGYWFGGWWGGGGGSSGSSGGTPILSDLCVPTMECGGTGKCDTQCCDGRHAGHSWVDLISREYRDEVTDLKVKIPGGEASVVRHFFRNAWHWADLARSLEFVEGADGLLKIRRWLIDYRPINTARTVFAYREIRITRDAGGWTWENKDGDWESYSLEGRLLSTGHRNLELSRFHYDADGRLASVSDRTGKTIFTYLYEGGQLKSVRDLSGREVQYTFTNDRLTAVRDAAGNEMTYGYDGEGRMVAKRDINGLELAITYQAGSQVSSVLDQHGNGDFFQFFYDKNNRQYYTSVRSTGGEITEKWFNAQGRLMDQVHSGVQGDKIQFDGRNEIITKNTGVVWFRDYDEWGNLTREVRPDGGVAQTDYHPVFHQPVREVNPRGAITLWQYDNQGNLRERIEAAGTEIARTNRWEYDEASRLIRRVDGRGNRMEYAYDEADNLIREFDPESPDYQTFYGYDVRGNRITMTNALGYVTLYGYDALDRLVAETNALGHVTLYTYQGKNLVEVETGREGENRGRIVRYRYDDHGRRTQTLRVDEQNQEHVWETTTYDADGQVIAIANALGQTSRFEYNAAGQRVKVVRPFSATETSDTQYVYDDFGRLVREVDPLGVITRYEYDEINRRRKVTEALGTPVQRSREQGYDLAGNLTSITYSDGTNALTALYTYDQLNRRIQIRGAREYPSDFEYDRNDNLTAQINGRGYRTEHAYDPYNRRTNTVEGIGNGEPGEHAGSFEYNLIGNVVTTYDGNRNHRHYHHDAIGRPTEESIPLVQANAVPAGNWWLDDSVVLNRTWFNPWGQPVATSNIVGAVTGTVYDGFGRRFMHTDAAGLTLTNTYNALDQVVEVGYPVVSSAPAGSPPTSIRYDYDSYNAQMLVATTDRANLTTRYSYDRRLQRSSELSSWGALTTYRYDELGHQTAVTNALEEVTQSVFDQFDQLVATVYADHIPVKQERIEYRAYDQFDRMTNHWGAATYDVTYTYDLSGNQTSLTDGNGNTTRWEYDGRNRKVRKIYADNSDYEYGYDNNGNQIRKRDAMQRTTGYEFNAYDLLVLTDYPNDADVTFGYDPGGRRVLMVDGTGTNIWSYDAAGRVLENAQFNVEHAVSYTYDAEGNRLSMTVTPLADGNVWRTEYAYDRAGRLEDITDHGVSDIPFHYTWATNAILLTVLTYPSGLKTTQDHDLLGRKTVLSTRDNANVELARFAYGHDKAGQRTNETTLTYTDRFEYDANRQLISAHRYDLAGSIDSRWSYSYTYDPTGNWTIVSNPDGVHRYSVNLLNQYTLIANDAARSLIYDGNGNLLSDGETTYEFEENDYLTTVSNSNERVSVRHDGIGRRVFQQSLMGYEGNSIRIVYDGELAVGEISEGVSQMVRITRGLDFSLSRDRLGGIGGILMTKAINATNLISDGRGNIRVFISEISTQVSSVDYTAFGESVNSDPDVGPFGFSSKERFSLIPLSDFGFRLYHASQGRWIGRDRIEELGGVNLYAYVQNDPVNLLDPNGLKATRKKHTITWPGIVGRVEVHYLVDDETCNLSQVYCDLLGLTEFESGLIASGNLSAVVNCGKLQVTRNCGERCGPGPTQSCITTAVTIVQTVKVGAGGDVKGIKVGAEGQYKNISASGETEQCTKCCDPCKK